MSWSVWSVWSLSHPFPLSLPPNVRHLVAGCYFGSFICWSNGSFLGPLVTSSQSTRRVRVRTDLFFHRQQAPAWAEYPTISQVKSKEMETDLGKKKHKKLLTLVPRWDLSLLYLLAMQPWTRYLTSQGSNFFLSVNGNNPCCQHHLQIDLSFDEVKGLLTVWKQFLTWCWASESCELGVFPSPRRSVGRPTRLRAQNTLWTVPGSSKHCHQFVPMLRNKKALCFVTKGKKYHARTYVIKYWVKNRW